MKLEQLDTLAKLIGVQIRSSQGPTQEIDEDGTIDDIIAKLEAIPYIPYATALHTVDVIAFKIDVHEKNAVSVLLGRKKNQEAWQILGGFLNPAEAAEDAAVREAGEETSNTLQLDKNKLIYLKSHFIDDERYRNTCHKITTSFYKILVDENVKVTHGDDISEVRWFAFSDLRENYKTIVRPLHHVLIEAFLKSFKP